jgi:hypothetical protein
VCQVGDNKGIKKVVIEFCNSAATSRCLVYADLLGHYKILHVLLNWMWSSLHVCESYEMFDLYIPAASILLNTCVLFQSQFWHQTTWTDLKSEIPTWVCLFLYILIFLFLNFYLFNLFIQPHDSFNASWNVQLNTRYNNI